MLRFDQIIERGLLPLGGLQLEYQMLEHRLRVQYAPVKLCPRHRMDVSQQSGYLVFVNCGGDAVGGRLRQQKSTESRDQQK